MRDRQIEKREFNPFAKGGMSSDRFWLKVQQGLSVHSPFPFSFKETDGQNTKMSRQRVNATSVQPCTKSNTQLTLTSVYLTFFSLWVN